MKGNNAELFSMIVADTNLVTKGARLRSACPDDTFSLEQALTP